MRRHLLASSIRASRPSTHRASPSQVRLVAADDGPPRSTNRAFNSFARSVGDAQATASRRGVMAQGRGETAPPKAHERPPRHDLVREALTRPVAQAVPVGSAYLLR